MALIRHLEVLRFRGIAHGHFFPTPGLNALIGPGDSGKSTLLDAIDLVLQPRRSATFGDADFYKLDVGQPILITATLGALPASLLDLDTYGAFLRGWDDTLKRTFDEPTAGCETVLSMRLTVSTDLEPKWSLYSARAEADGLTRDLPWAEKVALAPTRLGAFASHHFSWSAKSVLNRLSEQRATAPEALAEAARQARAAFGERAVADTLRIVTDTAKSAGVPGAEGAKALLDAHGVSFSGGAIALHDADGVPLRNLGVGSSRLLVASLQAVAGDEAAISLIDEAEHGLEPYRISRLLHRLGSKTVQLDRQVFLTTHSSVVLRELAAGQLWRVLRGTNGDLTARGLGGSEDNQKTIRANAEGFLAPNVLVCEGPTEIGLARGLDLYWTEQGQDSLGYLGVAPCDGGGSNMFARAACFGQMGYRTALWRDSDVGPTEDQQVALDAAGVVQFAWAGTHSTESQLFESLPEAAVFALLKIAEEFNGVDAVAQHLKNQGMTADHNLLDLVGLTPADRVILGKAAGKGKWFKWIEPAEKVGRTVLGPFLASAEPPLPATLNALRAWMLRVPPPPAPPVPPTPPTAPPPSIAPRTPEAI
jgi:hypothetical protein